MKKFKKELEKLINIHGIDNDLNTPDFILSQVLIDFLETIKWKDSQTERLKQ